MVHDQIDHIGRELPHMVDVPADMYARQMIVHLKLIVSCSCSHCACGDWGELISVSIGDEGLIISELIIRSLIIHE